MKTFKYLLIVKFSLLIAFGAFSQTSYNTFTDKRDNQTYNIVEIGGNVWMAQNLNYQTTESWCYDGNEENCQKYGRLYTGKVALKACPDGWHLPIDSDWENLVISMGGKNVAGKQMQETASGFSALFGGKMTNDNTYTGLGETASFWSVFEDGSKVWGRHLTKENPFLNSFENPLHKAYSIRCVKNN